MVRSRIEQTGCNFRTNNKFLSFPCLCLWGPSGKLFITAGVKRPEFEAVQLSPSSAVVKMTVAIVLIFRGVREIKKKKRILALPCLSVRSSVRSTGCNQTSPTGQIFRKFDVSGFNENLSSKLKFH